MEKNRGQGREEGVFADRQWRLFLKGTQPSSGALEAHRAGESHVFNHNILCTCPLGDNWKEGPGRATLRERKRRVCTRAQPSVCAQVQDKEALGVAFLARAAPSAGARALPTL